MRAQHTFSLPAFEGHKTRVTMVSLLACEANQNMKILHTLGYRVFVVKVDSILFHEGRNIQNFSVGMQLLAVSKIHNAAMVNAGQHYPAPQRWMLLQGLKLQSWYTFVSAQLHLISSMQIFSGLSWPLYCNLVMKN